MKRELYERLSGCPIIGAVRGDKLANVLLSPVELIFHLDANVLTLEEQIDFVHQAGKLLLVHIDLAEGVGKDAAGLAYLKRCGADGILSTKPHLIRSAKELGLFAVQRFFVLDSQSVESISGILNTCKPDMIEIMPGVLYKIIERLAKQSTPVISGGLIETKQEVTAALGHGAFAVSTGKEDLWSL